MSARLTRISLESVGFLGSLFNNLLPVSMRPCTPCLRRQYAVGIEGGSSQHRSQSLHEGPKKPQVPTESPDVEKAEMMRRAAESATAGMFPWERKQMDSSNKPMSRFDKMYWAAFAGAAVFLIVVNGRRYFTAKDPPTVDESLEKLKDEMALAIASGKTNILQCQDVFEGLTPKEIMAFVDAARQRARDARSKDVDEFDGLSPEEINALAATRALR